MSPVYRGSCLPNGAAVLSDLNWIAACPSCSWARPFASREAAVVAFGMHARTAGDSSHDRALRELIESESPLFDNWQVA